MSVQAGRMVSAEEVRGDVSRQSWGPAWTEDLQHTVAVQAEQIATVRALHERVVLGECVVCLETAPCPTARALGVSGE